MVIVKRTVSGVEGTGVGYGVSGVGSTVGGSDGLPLGALLGSAVGAVLGMGDGSAEGFELGMDVGMFEGSELGMDEGILEGSNVGGVESEARAVVTSMTSHGVEGMFFMRPNEPQRARFLGPSTQAVIVGRIAAKKISQSAFIIFALGFGRCGWQNSPFPVKISVEQEKKRRREVFF